MSANTIIGPSATRSVVHHPLERSRNGQPGPMLGPGSSSRTRRGTLPTTLTLDDGSQVVVRPISPDDGPALVAFHDSLSPESTRLRYFREHPHLTPQEVRWFTGPDHEHREGLLAFDGARVVAYACLDEVPGAGRADGAHGADAEVAFVVAEAWRNKGLARRLFAMLVEGARSRGFRHLVAETLCENRRMASVFEHSGLAAHHTIDHGVASYVMDLAQDDA